jgi:hypothetical protein
MLSIEVFLADGTLAPIDHLLVNTATKNPWANDMFDRKQHQSDFPDEGESQK